MEEGRWFLWHCFSLAELFLAALKEMILNKWLEAKITHELMCTSHTYRYGFPHVDYKASLFVFTIIIEEIKRNHTL